MVSPVRAIHTLMKYETHTNFLPVEPFQHIKDFILEEDFPWRRRDSMVYGGKKNQMFFTYSFYNEMNPSSEFYEPLIIPILKKLNSVAPIQVRTNMLISSLFNKSSWHTDYDYKCKTAILYLNDCDGGTEFKIDGKIIFIKAEANKIVVFDTKILHRAVTSKEEPIRYILNFNYFTK